jgi:hypothetical protein
MNMGPLGLQTWPIYRVPGANSRSKRLFENGFSFWIVQLRFHLPTFGWRGNPILALIWRRPSIQLPMVDCRGFDDTPLQKWTRFSVNA